MENSTGGERDETDGRSHSSSGTPKASLFPCPALPFVTFPAPAAQARAWFSSQTHSAVLHWTESPPRGKANGFKHENSSVHTSKSRRGQNKRSGELTQSSSLNTATRHAKRNSREQQKSKQQRFLFKCAIYIQKGRNRKPFGALSSAQSHDFCRVPTGSHIPLRAKRPARLDFVSASNLGVLGDAALGLSFLIHHTGFLADGLNDKVYG